MKRTGLLILIGLIFYCAVSRGQEVYQWMDEKGTLHFADDLSLVPEKYRNQVQKKKTSIEPTPLLSPQVTTEEDLEKEPKSAPERRDLMGRGEDWWKARAKEWNEKLLNANKNYETAHAAWKAKEKELEESKFKPKSLQRKLKSEMKALEEKANDWKKQMEQAKNMLEKGLPKEAEEFKADPDWIKIE
jgi:predicted  nucleic acid-binding Zn-ribbon protein